MDAGKNESNPFSFKSFLKRGEGPPAGTATSAAAVSKKGGSRKKGSLKKDQGEPFPVLDEEDTGTKKTRSENPFSFTKFVERKSSKSAASTPQQDSALFSSSSGDEGEDSSLTVVNHLPPLPASPAHATQKPPSAPRTSKSAKSSTSLSPALSTKKKEQKPKQQKKEISIFDDSNDEDSDSHSGLPASVNFPIPGTAVTVQNGTGAGIRRRTSASSSSSNSNSGSPRRRSLMGAGLGGDGPTLDGMMDVGFGEAAEVRKLRINNEQLLKELAQHQEELKKEKQKNASLKSTIKVLKKKEAEDTKALEDMVQKVESNLVTTTKRAVSAEAVIAKLKQEVTSLQVQLAKSTPEAVHQHYEDILRGVREKSTYASQQLVAASSMADKNIRELLSGAEMLKNIAEVLRFVDRISEVRTSEDNSAT